ncbi:hypothetical protein [Candidatus Lokiarchaeum ossiferum]
MVKSPKKKALVTSNITSVRLKGVFGVFKRRCGKSNSSSIKIKIISEEKPIISR